MNKIIKISFFKITLVMFLLSIINFIYFILNPELLDNMAIIGISCTVAGSLILLIYSPLLDDNSKRTEMLTKLIEEIHKKRMTNRVKK